MHDLGYLALLVALVTASFSGAATLIGRKCGRPSLENAGILATYTLAALTSVSAFSLLYLLVSHDFSVQYVQRHSDISTPLVFLVSAFWGGQEGSLLFWLWVLSIYSALAIALNRRHEALIPYANTVLSGIIAFFVLLVIFAANPFSTIQGEPPLDGAGLNPLLLNPYMVVHPPTMYMGYIGMAIPFAFGMAAMASGETGETWLRLCRRWTLIGWLFLSLGLILGKIWAYEELAWGGYWSWDPVENAGLLPWLTCTAFLHSVMIQERRGMFKKWNMTLVILSFLFTIVGTFITRSGIVQSVHSFAQSDIGHFFLAFLVFASTLSFGFMWIKARTLRSDSNIESMLSREFTFGLNNWILLGMAFFLVLATLFPSLSEHVTGQTISVGEPFYNEWMIPLGLILLLLTGVGPLIAWRMASVRSLTKQFLLPFALGCIVLCIVTIVGSIRAQGFAPIATYALATFVIATIIQEVFRGVRVRIRTKAESAGSAFVGLITRGNRRYGGYTIHLGVVLMFIGWTGNAFQLENETTMSPGEQERIGRFYVRYEGIRFTESENIEKAIASISVLNLDSRKISELEPARLRYTKRNQPASRVAIRTSLIDDLYIVLAGWDPDTNKAAIKLALNPLVLWVWIGSVVLIMGTALALWPDRSTRKTSIGSSRHLANNAGRRKGKYGWGDYFLSLLVFFFVMGFGNVSISSASIILLFLTAASASIATFLAARSLDTIRSAKSRLFEINSTSFLEQEKTRLLKAIKEIDFDHAMGKIDDDDHEELKAKYEADAIRVISLLDNEQDIWLEKAKNLADKEMARRKKKDAASPKSSSSGFQGTPALSIMLAMGFSLLAPTHVEASTSDLLIDSGSHIRIQFQAAKADVVQVLHVSNIGTTPYELERGIEISIPDSADLFVSDRPMEIDHDKSRAYLAGPFEPGTTIVRLGFSLPIRRGRVDFNQTINLPSKRFHIIIPHIEGTQISGINILNSSIRSSEGNTFRVIDIDMQERQIFFSIFGLPNNKEIGRGAALFISLTIISLAMVFSLVARTKENPKIAIAEADRQRILDELEQLELDLAEKLINQHDYDTDRRDLLCRLAANLKTLANYGRADRANPSPEHREST